MADDDDVAGTDLDCVIGVESKRHALAAIDQPVAKFADVPLLLQVGFGLTAPMAAQILTHAGVAQARDHRGASEGDQTIRLRMMKIISAGKEAPETAISVSGTLRAAT